MRIVFLALLFALVFISGCVSSGNSGIGACPFLYSAINGICCTDFNFNGVCDFNEGNPPPLCDNSTQGSAKGILSINFTTHSGVDQGTVNIYSSLLGCKVVEKNWTTNETLNLGLPPGEYVAKVERLCPQGYNEKRFTIIENETVELNMSVRICV